MQGVYQTSYGFNRDAAYAGLIESSENVITGINATRRLYSVVVGGTTDGIYRILYDGVIVGEYTASSNTAAQIRDALLADLVADGTMTAEASSTNTILIESKSYSESPEVTSTTTGATLTVTELVPQSQEIGFGLGVVADPRETEEDKQVRLPRLTGEISGPTFKGITVADTSRQYNANGYPSQAHMSILRSGRIWCRSEGTIVKDTQPYCRFASGAGGSQLGIFRGDADTSTAVQPKGLIAVTGVTGAGIFLAEFRPQT